MKKFIDIFLSFCVIVTLASCNKDADIQTQPSSETPTPVHGLAPIISPTGNSTQAQGLESELFPGKIGIVTYYNQPTYDRYGARIVVEKYGEEKIVHNTWSESMISDKEYTLQPFKKLHEYEDIKTIITNPAIPYVSEAINELKEDVDDIFYICAMPSDDPADISKQADIVLQLDDTFIGSIVVQQAKKMDAKIFIHYSYERHMTQPNLYQKRDLIKQECDKLNIEFVDATSINPLGEAGLEGTRQFILEDVPNMVAKYGKDTAFFFTSLNSAISFCRTVVDTGAIYIHNSELSPYLVFSEALGIDIVDTSDILAPHDLIFDQITAVLAEKNMLGRVATLPVDTDMMFVEVSAEYAIKRLNGEAPQRGIDMDLLKRLMEDYAGVPVYLTPYTDDETGETYDNYLMVTMDYITFE